MVVAVPYLLIVLALDTGSWNVVVGTLELVADSSTLAVDKTDMEQADSCSYTVVAD